jgi:hypothetical protein
MRSGETEFGGEQDKTMALQRLPRPLTSASDKLRAGYLSGDSSGTTPADGRFSFRGLDRKRFVAQAKASLKYKKNMPERVLEVGDQQA